MPRSRASKIIVHCAGTAKGDERQGDEPGPRRHRGPACGTSCTSRSSGPTGSRWPERIDRTCSATSASKHAAERIVAGSGLPWSTLRATQFFSLTLATAQRLARLPVIPVPAGFRFQPVDPGRGRGPARGARARLAGRPRARPRRAEGVRDGRARPHLPGRRTGRSPPDRLDADPGEGRGGDPCRRQPRPRPGGGHPDMGGVPCRSDGLGCRARVRRRTAEPTTRRVRRPGRISERRQRGDRARTAAAPRGSRRPRTRRTRRWRARRCCRSGSRAGARAPSRSPA